MEVRWLEQGLTDVSREADWLSSTEVARLAGMRVPKRNQDWRLGRWTTKNAVATYLRLPIEASTLTAIEIRPLPSGAPEVFLHGRPAPLAISLSHRGRRAVCTIAPEGTAIGCDLELIEPRDEAFIGDYFTPAEQRLVAEAAGGGRFRTLALLWSAKESVLKALHEGLRIDTRQIEVSLGNTDSLPPALRSSKMTDTWHPLRARFEDRLFSGWWQEAGEFVLTIAGGPGLGLPVQLAASSLASRPA